ncbi:hypothetical protein F444_19812 [Phytophthora nicotianae P1976]|uniref:Uncharacterized protein n=1 Tax=Phytophthora nicotianae P1976 TaxID=1317066 RepID=A0A080Z6I3_PHYNI|nr:hypothetical protein F444_19812 [Phytophthora nicotianae P1976]
MMPRLPSTQRMPQPICTPTMMSATKSVIGSRKMACPATFRCAAANLIRLRIQHTYRIVSNAKRPKTTAGHQYQSEPLSYAFLVRKIAAKMLSTMMVMRATQMRNSASRTMTAIQTTDMPAAARPARPTILSMSFTPEDSERPWTFVASMKSSPYLAANTMVTTTTATNGIKKKKSLHSRLTGGALLSAGGADG